MDQARAPRRIRTVAIIFTALVAILAAAHHVGTVQAQSNATPATSLNDSELIAQFRRVEVASVFDALEQIVGKKLYMSHRMQPIFAAKFAGYARTVQLKKDEGNKDPEALTGMLEPIDHGSTDAVYVMVVEDGVDIAGMGGFMETDTATGGSS